MNFLNDLKNNSLLICPNDIKNTVLQELNKMKKLINIKFMTIEELIKKYYLMGLYTVSDLDLFVKVNWITEEQKAEIIASK